MKKGGGAKKDMDGRLAGQKGGFHQLIGSFGYK